MPRKPGRPRPPATRPRRARPPARSRFREEPAATRARMAAAGAAMAILSGPPSPRAGVALGREVGELADRAIRRVHEVCGDGDQVACQIGCTYCCRFPVAASAPEILRIAAYVRDRFDPARQAALDARLDAHIAATGGMDMEQRDRVRPDCPFLESGACSVYEARPVACRGVSSYDADACREDCDQPGAGVEIPTNALRELAHGAVREGLAVACRSAGADHRPLELARAYRIAAADPTLAETWRDRPGAFDAAVGARVFPGPWSDELESEFEDVYQDTVGRLGGPVP